MFLKCPMCDGAVRRVFDEFGQRYRSCVKCTWAASEARSEAAAPDKDPMAERDWSGAAVLFVLLVFLGVCFGLGWLATAFPRP